jgi:hypothetical protein
VAKLSDRLTRLVLALRHTYRAMPPAPGDAGALSIDRFLKRCAGAAGRLGADLNLIAALCGTDKFGQHFYTDVYEALAKPMRKAKVSLLELGVGGYTGALGGESLLMWASYFRRGRIYGIDVFDKTALSRGRIKVLQCSQVDRESLAALAREAGPFDFIVDDGSHRNEHQIESFRILWPFVKDGGVYIVEDVQTSYWPAFGGAALGTPAHQGTCMAYFKRLIDSVNTCEFLDPVPAGLELQSTIGSIAFHHNLIVLVKDRTERFSNMPLHDADTRNALARVPVDG